MTMIATIRAHAGAHRHSPVASQRRRSWPHAASLAWLLLAAPTAPLAAQTVVLSLGDSARVQVAPGTKVTVPLTVNLSAAAGTTLASLQGRVTWAASQLTLDSVRATGSAGWTVLSNLDSIAEGRAGVVTYGAAALPASGPIGALYFTAATNSNGGTRVTFTPSAAGNESGQSILPQLQLRPLDACVAPSGKWGDANDDGAVNVIDAQQIARASIGLSVASAAVLSARGDVTADGLVNVLDAQQIARYSVALSAAARINVLLYTPPTVASVVVSPAPGTVALGSVLQLTADPRDAGGASVAGCPVITWSSASATVATVSTSGLVTGVTLGSSGISASSGSTTASAAITVTGTTGLWLTAPVVAGEGHSCALDTNGAVYCWGDTNYGAPLDSPARIRVPTLVSGSPAFRSIARGMYHNCGITAAGTAFCWGDNAQGKLGNGDPNISRSTVPIAVAGGLTFASIAASTLNTCGLTPTGAAFCWGANNSGQLGTGTNDPTSSLVPKPVAGGLSFTAITAGSQYNCALTATGVAYCWGVILSGQLGTNFTTSTSPVRVAGDLTFKSISAGTANACGLTTTGMAYCWGNRVLLGTTDNVMVPVPVSGGLTFTTLALGGPSNGSSYGHVCGLTPSGAAYCWGDNANSQLGNNSTTYSGVPVPVAGGQTFSAISAGGFHTCAVTTAGAGYCWGLNAFGQLGNNSTVSNSTVPVPVSGGLTFRQP